MDFFRRQNWDVVSKWPFFFGLSAVPIIIGIVFIATQGMNWGTDFTGGSIFTFQFSNQIISADSDAAAVIGRVRAGMPTEALRESAIQVAGSNQIIVRTAALTDEARAADQQAIEGALRETLGQTGGEVRLVGRDFVGPVVGADLQKRAVQALIIGSLLIVLYITIRYEFRFAIAAMLALLHDLLVLVGGMAVLRLVVDSSFVAVVLTILGYSVHDTIIIFDRIRENRRLHRGASFPNTVNASIMQTMTRSVNTVLCTLFPLITLFFLGGPRLHGFVTALIIGLVSGAYSSIFMAAQIVVLWQGRRARARAAVSASAGAASLRPRPAPSRATAAGPEAAAEAPAPERSAMATLVRAQEAAQAEKREARRQRRQEKKTQKKGGGGKGRGRRV